MTLAGHLLIVIISLVAVTRNGFATKNISYDNTPCGWHYKRGLNLFLWYSFFMLVTRCYMHEKKN